MFPEIWIPVKKKRKSVKKEEHVKDANARAAEIINMKAKSSDKMWKKNIHMFNPGNQGQFGFTLRREAEKISSLMVCV